MPPRDPIEAAKAGNLGQLLLRSARLYDTIVFSRFAAGHPEFRRSHVQLMPHLDLEGTRITVLAERAGVSKQAIAQVVNDMEAAGHVERRPDPTDGRAKVVVLTAQGRAAVVQGLGALAALRHELAEEVGPDELAQLQSLLEKLLPALEKRV